MPGAAAVPVRYSTDEHGTLLHLAEVASGPVDMEFHADLVGRAHPCVQVWRLSESVKVHKMLISWLRSFPLVSARFPRFSPDQAGMSHDHH